MKYLLVLIVLTGNLFSCATKKEIIYFQDIEMLDQQASNLPFEPIIEANDILHISISSLNAEVVRPFLRNAEISLNTNTETNPGLDGYLVNADGNIRFNIIGDIQVAGKSRSEVVELLSEKLSEYIKDFVVDVRIMNFKISVIGEVKMPGVYTIKDERVTLTEAIALAGDFTVDGKRKDVLIIREEAGKRIIEKVNFTSSDFFASPFYFLKQNDVVYVEPSLKGVKKSGFIPDIPAMLSLVTIILSTVILLSR